MKKSKKSEEEPWDRLSKLPDSIIFEIFGFLPMRNVVRTTILSKRWKNLWTTTPYLNFSSRDSSKFINRALILWKGFKILKFKVVFRFPRKGTVYSDIDSWLHLAKENGIEELHLEDMVTQGDESRVRLPHDLYSCSSLKVLSLIWCKLQIDGNVNVNVQWNQLRSLTIDECDIDEHLINKVVCGSPQLEVLILNFWDNNQNLSIRSTSLKKLSIKRDECYDKSSTMNELRIWSPNLETLDFVGEPYGKYLLMNVSSLAHISVSFFDGSSCFGYDIGEILWEIFPTIRHVEKLTISDRCILILVYMSLASKQLQLYPLEQWLRVFPGSWNYKKEYLLSPLLEIKFLEINHDTQDSLEYKEILDFLQIFPKLETLVLCYYWQFLIHDPEEHDTEEQFERNLPESFLLQLRTVEITCSSEVDLIFPLIEILLKHATMLQKMVIRVRGIKPPSMPWLLAQKFLEMPRSSPTAKLIFAEY